MRSCIINAHPADIRQVFGRRLSHAARQWRRAMDERLQPFGLTDATWLPLLHIAQGQHPMRQKDLAETLGIEGSTLVRLIDALDDSGLVERQTKGDRRARVLHLTPRGRQRVTQLEAVAAQIREEVLAGVSDDDLRTTMNVIEHICAALAGGPEPEATP